MSDIQEGDKVRYVNDYFEDYTGEIAEVVHVSSFGVGIRFEKDDEWKTVRHDSVEKIEEVKTVEKQTIFKIEWANLSSTFDRYVVIDSKDAADAVQFLHENDEKFSGVESFSVYQVGTASFAGGSD